MPVEATQDFSFQIAFINDSCGDIPQTEISNTSEMKFDDSFFGTLPFCISKTWQKKKSGCTGKNQCNLFRPRQYEHSKPVGKERTAKAVLPQHLLKKQWKNLRMAAHMHGREKRNEVLGVLPHKSCRWTCSTKKTGYTENGITCETHDNSIFGVMEMYPKEIASSILFLPHLP